MVSSLQYFSRNKLSTKRVWLDEEKFIIRDYAGVETIEQITARINEFNEYRNIVRTPKDIMIKGNGHGYSFRIKKG